MAALESGSSEEHGCEHGCGIWVAIICRIWSMHGLRLKLWRCPGADPPSLEALWAWNGDV